MQGQRSSGSSFTETFDLNQGSVSNNTGMNQSSGWNSMLNPVESRLSNYALSSVEGNFATCANADSHSVRVLSGWDRGKSSSSANLQSQGMGSVQKLESDWSSPFGACPGDARVEERPFGQSNIFLRENISHDIGSNQGVGRNLFLQGSSSNRIPVNLNLNAGCAGSGDETGQSIGPDVCHNLPKLSVPEAGHLISANASSDNAGSSSSNAGFLVDNDGESASSFGIWGSCKRKALEGTSGQSYAGGSSNCFQQGQSFTRYGVSAHYSTASSLSISSPPLNSYGTNPEHPGPRIGITMHGVASDDFPPLGMRMTGESSSRNPGIRANSGQYEAARFNLQSTGNSTRHSDVCPPHQSRHLPFPDSLDLRPNTSVAPSSSNASNQPRSRHIPDFSRNILSSPWNGSLNARPGHSSSSLMLSGDRGSSLRDETNFGSTSRNSIEHPMFMPTAEMRSLIPEQNSWNLSTASSSTTGNVPSSSRSGHNSSIRPYPAAWIPNHSPPTQNQQRLSEFSPWTLFPNVDSESGGQRGRFSPLHSGPSSEETMMTSGASNHSHHSPYPRSGGWLMEVPGDDANGWRALAADIDGRHRLLSEIRQVLNAMRRGDNLRAEDFMLFDPFINVAELHDRHRDMRLDVDNMSYEELLALEERIGDVNTGLSEETIMESLKQRKCLSIMEASPSNIEPCCICQEVYVTGDDIGTLDCGHDFHTDCIKQWLTNKNICPICKMTGLGT